MGFHKYNTQVCILNGTQNKLCGAEYELDSSRFEFQQEKEIFLFSEMSRPVLRLT
jgi:hypothetical protein